MQTGQESTLRPQPRTRRSAWLTGLLAVAVLITSVVTPAASQAGSPVLGDGLWRVVFFLDQKASLSGVNFQYSGHGSSIVQMADGSASGEWNLSLTTVVLDSNSTANGVALGTISGTGSELVLDFSTITVTEASVGLTITLDADDLPPTGGGRLNMSGRGCSAITGDWTIPFNDTQLEGEFIAQRLGADGGETDADLRDDGLALIEQARLGIVDVSALGAFVERAEQGSEATARDDGCSLEASRIFGTAATLLLNTVLTETGYAADDLADAEFMDVYRLVLRSGLFETDPEVRLTWGHGLLSRLAKAVGSDDPADWRFWLPIAEQLGEDGVAQSLRQRICDERGDLFCEGVDG